MQRIDAAIDAAVLDVDIKAQGESAFGAEPAGGSGAQRGCKVRMACALKLGGLHDRLLAKTLESGAPRLLDRSPITDGIGPGFLLRGRCSERLELAFAHRRRR